MDRQIVLGKYFIRSTKKIGQFYECTWYIYISLAYIVCTDSLSSVLYNLRSSSSFESDFNAKWKEANSLCKPCLLALHALELVWWECISNFSTSFASSHFSLLGPLMIYIHSPTLSTFNFKYCLHKNYYLL